MSENRDEKGQFRKNWEGGPGRPKTKEGKQFISRAKREYLAWIRELSPSGKAKDLPETVMTQLRMAKRILSLILSYEGEQLSDNQTELMIRSMKQVDSILKSVRMEMRRRIPDRVKKKGGKYVGFNWDERIY